MSSNVLPFTPRNSGTSAADAPERATPATVTRAVYTVAEVAELLSLSTGSTYALVRKGDIPAMKLGGRWVIPVRRFEAWLDNLPTASVADLDRELAALDRAAGRGRTRHGA